MPHRFQDSFIHTHSNCFRCLSGYILRSVADDPLRIPRKECLTARQ
jgi:hypothetical protein